MSQEIKTESVAGVDLYWFDTEKDLKEFLIAEKSKWGNYDDYDYSWDEPGWYRLFTKEKPCPKHCCYDQIITSEPAIWLMFDWQKRATDLNNSINEFKELLDIEE